MFVSLKNQKQFDIVNKHGVKISASCFIAIWDRDFNSRLLRSTNSDEDCFHFGFKVSKKFSPKATERNLAKRRIRSAIRIFAKNNNIFNGGIIIIPKKNFNSTLFSNISQELNRIIVNSNPK